MTLPDTLTIAPDSPLSQIAGHLQGAIGHAQAALHEAPEQLNSPWANTAFWIILASGHVGTQLQGVVATTVHPNCATALHAARRGLDAARDQADLPAGDLHEAYELVELALSSLVATQPPQTQPVPGSLRP